MKKIRRIISLILTLLMCMSSGLTAIAMNTDDEPIARASDYLNYYSAYVITRSGGKVIIEFEVDGVGKMDTIGINRLVIQEKIDGKWTSLPTIWGSTSNGLISESSIAYIGEYIHETDSGTECRAIVTVYAEKDGGSDSRTITTNSVTAK